MTYELAAAALLAFDQASRSAWASVGHAYRQSYWDDDGQRTWSAAVYAAVDAEEAGLARAQAELAKLASPADWAVVAQMLPESRWIGPSAKGLCKALAFVPTPETEAEKLAKAEAKARAEAWNLENAACEIADGFGRAGSAGDSTATHGGGWHGEDDGETVAMDPDGNWRAAHAAAQAAFASGASRADARCAAAQAVAELPERERQERLADLAAQRAARVAENEAAEQARQAADLDGAPEPVRALVAARAAVDAIVTDAQRLQVATARRATVDEAEAANKSRRRGEARRLPRAEAARTVADTAEAIGNDADTTAAALVWFAYASAIDAVGAYGDGQTDFSISPASRAAWQATRWTTK